MRKVRGGFLIDETMMNHVEGYRSLFKKDNAYLPEVKSLATAHEVAVFADKFH